jgi:hypothetical protein
MTTWNTTVATPGADFSSANTATLATVGPFTLIGSCYQSGSTTIAETDITTSQDHSSLNDYESSEFYSRDFGVTDGPLAIGETASDGASHSPDWEGPYDGESAAQSADGKTILDAFENVGTYMLGTTGPACSFSGYLVQP